MNNPLFKPQNNYQRPPVFIQQQYRPQQYNQPINRPPFQNNINQNRPTPMDTSSGNTRKVLHHNIHSNENEINQLENYEEYQYHEENDENENFQEIALIFEPSDTLNSISQDETELYPI